VNAQPIGTILPAVLQQAGTRREALAALQDAWPRLVGRTLAAHTRPITFRSGRLTVQADRPGDSFLLSYQRPQLLARLRAATQTAVDEMVIRPGGSSTARRRPPRRRT